MRTSGKLPSWLQQAAQELMNPPYFYGSSSQQAQRRQGFRTTESETANPGARSAPGRATASGLTENHGESARPKEPDEESSIATRFNQAGFPATLPQLYGWKVKSVERVREVLKVTTTNGAYALKQTHISPDKVDFLAAVVNRVRGMGLVRVVNYEKTQKTQQNAVLITGKTYVATPWILGNEANFASTRQLGEVAQTLADFYEKTRGFDPDGYSPSSEFGLQKLHKSRAADLEALVSLAKKRSQDEFDYLLQSTAVELQSDARECLHLLEEPQNAAFLRRDQRDAGLCHLDVVPRNFIYTPEHEAHLLDLDLAAYAPRVLDLAHLLRRSMQVHNWSFEAAYACLARYDAVRTIAPEEYMLLVALLRFPHKPWRLAHARYRVQSSPLQVEELRTYVRQSERRNAFLAAFKKQARRRFV